ncbi:Mur ligase [Coniella lustricola]|uniref:Mur ligase n=1 Tax=Coniella lustricola TaxID=2025994 RepID=A0A2T3A0I4_9PEZI|nr:Mur ligase [Coniella lustricola]
MIELGLSRISRLLQHTPQTWQAIHVAGTNGKGSTCAYIAALLHASGKSCARFNSPHFVDRWDCITINERPVSESRFLAAERLVKERDQREAIGASEFELLTATAFELLHAAQVDFGVIEVGLGGALDATNALKHKAVTVITKIGLDHQALLGNTLEEIAAQKAGILRGGAFCVVDESNPPEVLRVVEERALAVGAGVVHAGPSPKEAELLARHGFEPHQVQNVASALQAFQLACPELPADLETALPAIKQAHIPGRLQRVDLDGAKILLDGAHNVQSAEVLAHYVDTHLRADGQPVTWVLAASDGKDVSGILEVLVRPHDLVTAVQFGAVDGMPWVRPQDPHAILAAAAQLGASTFTSDAADSSIGKVALETAPAKGHPVVVAGSNAPAVNTTMNAPNHLIISEWIMESWKAGETPTYADHIKAGLRVLSEDERAVLIFSGGPTAASTSLSEARSYHNLAIANGYWDILPASSSPPPHPSPSPSPLPCHHPRILLEERALDSYQNILFSILHFWRTATPNKPAHTAWPSRLTIVSHAFKRTRLVDAHSCSPLSLAFPRDAVDFIGINPPGVPLVLGNEQRAVEEWLVDPQGWESEGLRKKRDGRNPWGLEQLLFLAEDERKRSGIVTRFVDGGKGEVLDVAQGGRWPWVVG